MELSRASSMPLLKEFEQSAMFCFHNTYLWFFNIGDFTMNLRLKIAGIVNTQSTNERKVYFTTHLFTIMGNGLFR